MSIFSSRKAQQNGVTLVEVLIAVVILAVGLLGIAGLQASALTNTAVAYQYTQAATIGQSLVERMRGNRSAVIDSTQPYALAVGGPYPNPTVNCSTTSCTPAQTAQYDLAVWLQAISSAYTVPSTFPTSPSGVLPSGQASVVCDPSTTCSATSNWFITVFWDSDRTGRTKTTCDTSDSTALNCFRMIYRP